MARVTQSTARRSERALLVAIESRDDNFQHDLEELHELLRTAGGEAVGTLTQRRESPSPVSYLGKGKVETLREQAAAEHADLVIVDDDLSALQLRNLEEQLQIPVIDRTQLILDIFARRARTKEGKLQVELAQLTYLLPRITGHGAAMSRLGGGIGTRGPGETKLETDRRRIHQRIQAIEHDLERVRGGRT